MTPLKDFDLPRKVLATGFLVVLSCGFAVAHLYLHHAVDKEDGHEDFVPTLRDITLHFHGEPGVSRLKSKVLGSMKVNFSAAENPNVLTSEEQADLDAVLAWNAKGGPEDEYWNPKDHQEARRIQGLLLDRGCLDCHSPDATETGNKKDSPLDTYAAIAKYLKPNTGLDAGTLLMLSHVHLLGMGLMFLGVGVFVAASRYSARGRALLIGGGFLAVLLDIGGWWAVKWGGAVCAPVVLAGGALMGVTFSVSVAAVLWELWGKKS